MEFATGSATGDRVNTQDGDTKLKQPGTIKVTNWEIKPPTCCEKFCLLLRCSWHDSTRCYLYSRDNNSIEANDINNVDDCCTTNCCTCWWCFEGQDNIRVNYFDRTPYAKKCNRAPCAAWLCCMFCYCNEPKLEIMDSSWLCCCIKIDCENCGCGGKQVVLMPFEQNPPPCCCCTNRVGCCDNCCGCCGQPTGNPKIYSKFSPQPKHPQAFIDAVAAVKANKRRPSSHTSPVFTQQMLRDDRPAAAPPGAPPPAAAAAKASKVAAALEDGRKKVEKLKELAALKEQGILTEEEFAQQTVILVPPLKELTALKEQGILTEEEFAQQTVILVPPPPGPPPRPPPGGPPPAAAASKAELKAAVEVTQKGLAEASDAEQVADNITSSADAPQTQPADAAAKAATDAIAAVAAKMQVQPEPEDEASEPPAEAEAIAAQKETAAAKVKDPATVTMRLTLIRSSRETPNGLVLQSTADGVVAVKEVKKGSIAEAAGVQAGDILVEVNGVPAPRSATLATERLKACGASNITLTITRYRVGETVYFASKRTSSLITGKEWKGTSRITFGQRGKVMGPYPKDASQLAINFEGDSNTTVCLPTELSRSKPFEKVADKIATSASTPQQQSATYLISIDTGLVGMGLKEIKGAAVVIVSSIDDESAAIAQGAQVNSVVLAVNGESTYDSDKAGVLAKIESAQTSGQTLTVLLSEPLGKDQIMQLQELATQPSVSEEDFAEMKRALVPEPELKVEVV